MTSLNLMCRQMGAVLRLELGKSLFSRRGLWVYLLAIAPVLIYAGHAVFAPRERARLERLAADNPVTHAALKNISKGMKREEVLKQIGDPYWQRQQRHHRRKFIWYKYTDGNVDVTYHFVDDELRNMHWRTPNTLNKAQFVFATSYQFFFLRLAIFFGCVGIFINLFRGEMLDKSLHFYLLTPMRRETLLLGKYIAGLIATSLIFTTSTALQWSAMVWPFESSAVTAFLNDNGWQQLLSYIGVTALACVGYGSIFLAIGLCFRNPIVPTAIILLWEEASPFLPPILKKMSMIHYLQSICPIAALPDKNLPPMMQLLIAPTEAASIMTSLMAIALLTAFVLMISGYLARRLEINYSSD